jgi:hypothetical protein
MSTAVKLYDANNVLMDVQDGVAIPAGTSGTLLHGSDGTNARRMRMHTDGSVFEIARTSVKATYAASTNGVVPTSTAANTTASIAYLFRPSSSARRVEILQILASASGNGGNNALALRGSFITAENGTPGGTAQTINALEQSDTASTFTFRTGATGSPTRGTGDLFSWALIGGSAAEIFGVMFDVNRLGKPIVLRASQNEGFEIRSVIGGSNIASAVNIGLTFIWTEE